MKTTLDEMLGFIRVVDSGSITAAARQLAQTTSGISRTLGRLEEKLGITLLRRTTRKLELTEEGQAFLVHARGIVAAVEQAEEQMRIRRQQPAGRLRVNAASPFMLHQLVPLVAAFQQRYPDIALELHSSDNIIDLLEQRTDVAIRIGKLRDSSLHARPLMHCPLRVLASPTYLARHGTPATPEHLAQHRLLGFTEPDGLNTWPLQHAGGDGYTIQAALHASSGETLRQLALAGNGLVCLSDFMTGADRASGQLVQVLAEHTLPTRQAVHAVYYQNTELAARIRCFVDFLLDQLAAGGTAP